MKKLMIALAVVALATVSQAASFRWNASGVLGPDGKTSYTGSATLFAIIDGTPTQVGGGSMTNGAIPASVITSDAFEVGKQYNFYYVMNDAKTGATFTSGTLTGAGQKSATPMLGFGNAGAWAVPEPTSGLLLLLGVAGLALKRKHA